jgi:hypothetical protein
VLHLVDGTPGAGKSYFAVRQVDAALAAGKVVVTNVPLSPDFAERAARAHPLRRLSRRAVARRAELYRSRVLVTRSLEEVLRVRVAGAGEGRAVVVLDEAHRWLNSRMWGKDTGRADVIAWVSGHRHLGLDVFLISQHIEDIDKQVRNRVEYRVRLRNLRRVKVAGVRLFPCNFFVAVSELVSAKNKPITGRDWYPLSKRVAGMYDTHGLAGEDIPEDAIWLPRVPEPVACPPTKSAGSPPAFPIAEDPAGAIVAAPRAPGSTPVPPSPDRTTTPVPRGLPALGRSGPLSGLPASVRRSLDASPSVTGVDLNNEQRPGGHPGAANDQRQAGRDRGSG